LLSEFLSTTPSTHRWRLDPTISNNLVNDARVVWSHVTLNQRQQLGIERWGQFGNTLGMETGNPGNS